MTTLRSPEALERGTAVPTPPSRTRDPWFDNIKMVLVTLVVVGHAWAVLPRGDGVDWAYDFLYSWHMPAFAIITGYFSRRFSWTSDRLLSLVTTVAVPYVIFEAALTYYRHLIGGIEVDGLFADPHWPMWYLAALFFWRLSAPAFLALPRWAALGAAVTISVASGFFAGETLDAPRILGLLPFFVLGLLVSDRDWARVRASATRGWALLVLVGLLALARYTDAWISTEWYYYRSTYDALQPNDLAAAGTRLALLATGLVGALALFAVVPRGKSWFSTLGAATLVVYLFHGFLLLPARYLGALDWSTQHPLAGFLTASAAAVLLALALAAPPVARRLNVAVDPVGWVRRRREAAAKEQEQDQEKPREAAPSSA